MGEQKRLSPRQKEIIADIILKWDGMPQWDDIIKATKVRLGFCPTRAALYKQEVIRSAREKKTTKRGGGRQKSKALLAAEERIERSLKEVQHLEKVNADLVDKFLRWSYNATHATRAPLTEADLEKEIPKLSYRGD
jgi:hypothetical protein